MLAIKEVFKDKEFNNKYFRYFGYASIDKPEDVIPNVTISFYSFHLMVVLGFLFILIFSAALYLLFKGTISDKKWFLWIALLSIPLPYIAGELGWVLTEMGRQPWIIQDMMTVSKAVSQIKYRFGNYNIHSFCSSVHRIAYFRNINYGQTN